jgi:hypothetical protein
MGYPTSNADCCGISRRGFLVGAGTGLALGIPAAWLGLRGLANHPDVPNFSGKTVEVPNPKLGMPGPYPGRVIEVHHPGSVNDDNQIQAPAVKQMMDRGMCDLTGADHPVEAWRKLFEKDDVVGIKVNPVGRKVKPGDEESRGRVANAVGAISSPEVLLEVVAGLKSAGVKPQDIIIFERYADEFRKAGYDDVMAERVMDGVRWYAASSGYDGSQLNIDGYANRDRRSGRDRHVVGYDPDVFVHMGFTASKDRRDDRRFRSHLTLIVTKMVNKFITIPVLKDHRTGGVTLALKNLSHGFNNNVARSHLDPAEHGAVTGPNQCGTFIPTACSHQPLREKATLHIMDGLIGVYEGGPGSWNASWGTWRRRSLFFATDPVAMDHVGWDIIDAKRAEMGWPPVAAMGAQRLPPGTKLSMRLAGLAASYPLATMNLAGSADNLERASRSENFDRRQPEHVVLAGSIGLGVFNADQIEHRTIKIKG